MNRLVLLLVAICSIATMLYFSSRTAEISSQQSQMIIDIIKLIGIEPSSYFIRKLAHFTIFVIIGFCISLKFKILTQVYVTFPAYVCLGNFFIGIYYFQCNICHTCIVFINRNGSVKIK